MKQTKEARWMPGVKKLHQESENSSKSDYIFGHLFGAVGFLAGTKAIEPAFPPTHNEDGGVTPSF
ncbi:hypothetical protein L1N85_26885 [Paenibacillus alkaliterrae]|uniref:hypothetical protein n=1 Tax=Paenibacillus alkaliterrae TaxID=320909 RepID=UPI001F29B969|nr:hypothetical protein [Paenibacillus alkaliterrae]MCF2941945.1 hypothetical protein [Paenibacillus alkaliterrae]